VSSVVAIINKKKLGRRHAPQGSARDCYPSGGRQSATSKCFSTLPGRLGRAELVLDVLGVGKIEPARLLLSNLGEWMSVWAKHC